MRKLPEDFFLGAAMSGAQTEGAYLTGGKLESVWDLWSDESITDFHNSVGSYVGNDFYHRYEEDMKILKDLGLDSFRTSIQWSRFLDEDGEINPEGAEYYHKVFAAAKKYDLEVFVTLYHFDMPAHMLMRGGWESREVVEAYANYVKKVFNEFATEIKYWFTFNEPVVEPTNCYKDGIWYPFVKDIKRAMTCQYHISIAHSLAVGTFRELQAKGVIDKTTKIGLVNCFAPPYTKENPSPEDLEAVRMDDGINNRWWLDLVAKGKLPEDVLETMAEMGSPVPERAGDKEILKLGKVDWLGFNYYHPSRVQAPKNKYDENGNPVFSEPYVWKDAKMNESRGWEIFPKGIYDFGMKIKNEYPELSFYISENGLGIEGEDSTRDKNGVIVDDYRVEFVKEHLEWIAKAIEEGVKCKGYHYWAVIDNWSWKNAYKNRYGFVEVNLNKGFDRFYKKSAQWLKKVAETHEI